MLKVQKKNLVQKIKIFFQQPEVIGIFCVVLTLFLFLSLLSFNPTDKTFFYQSTQINPYHNWCGIIGAQCAALLFFLFGASAYLFVLLGFFIGYRLFFRVSLFKEWDRLIACIMFIPLLSTIMNFYSIDLIYFNYPGGAIGNVIHTYFNSFMEPLIESLFLFVTAMVCIILITRISFIYVGHYLVQLVYLIGDKERFLNPVWQVIKKTTYYGMLPLIFLAKKTWQLLNGTEVEGLNQSIVHFEFEDIIDEELNSDDELFWHNYFKLGTSKNDVEPEIRNVQEVQQEPIHEEQSPAPEKLEYNAEQEIDYRLPPVTLFHKQYENNQAPKKEHEKLARILEEKLERFGIFGRVIGITVGPVITMFEYEPHIDSKISKIIALEDDLALALEAVSIRIIAPIPGRSVVGFEVANKHREKVLLSTILHRSIFKEFSGHLPIVLGQNVMGADLMVDLVSMPHLLVAGSTGSGKSVALNTMLVSLLCQKTPQELRLILIDPKRLEFAAYTDIPHLLFPIVTEAKKVPSVLKWVVKTMEDRYVQMAEQQVRNIFDYNQIAQKQGLKKMSFIVVIIDELSDLMMTASKEIEDLIARIAQMARAAGIHMIVATQRPSVDVITGLIKVNFPSRISFRVTSKIDSRTIIDCTGADKLLGKGDMLYLDPSSRLIRAHGAYVSDEEIEELVYHIRLQQPVEYIDLAEELPLDNDILLDSDDQLYQEVLEFIKTIDEISISLLQRKFRIGYNRSARIIDMLESQGLIVQGPGGKTRKVI